MSSRKNTFLLLFAVLVIAKVIYAKMITDPKTDITYNKINKWWRPKTKTQIFDPKVDIKYYLYTQYDQQNGTELFLNETEVLEASTYVHSRPLRIIIHGFKNNHTSPLNRILKNGYIRNHDVNVFVVDWGKAAKRHLYEYETAKYHVPLVGKYVGKFIQWLSKNESDLVELTNRTTIVGHSLGAHIAGYAGTYLNGSLDTIVGLDPAGTRFFYDVPESRLNTTDAQHVQVIHTYAYGSIYGLGFKEPIGHADFYPNFGASQPGCDKPDKDVKKKNCSHSRAWIYFAESLGKNRFWARYCRGGFTDIEEKNCSISSTKRYYMGGDPVMKLKGVYYLETNDQAPYGKDLYYELPE